MYWINLFCGVWDLFLVVFVVDIVYRKADKPIRFNMGTLTALKSKGITIKDLIIIGVIFVVGVYTLCAL